MRRAVTPAASLAGALMLMLAARLRGANAVALPGLVMMEGVRNEDCEIHKREAAVSALFAKTTRSR